MAIYNNKYSCYAFYLYKVADRGSETRVIRSLAYGLLLHWSDRSVGSCWLDLGWHVLWGRCLCVSALLADAEKASSGSPDHRGGLGAAPLGLEGQQRRDGLPPACRQQQRGH